MRASTAYLAGGGTVILAIVVGIAGGLIMGNMVAPQSPKQGVEQTRLERQKSPEPVQAAGPSEPVPYLATTQARSEAIAAATALTQPQPESNAVSTAAPPVQASAVATLAPQPTASPQSATASAQPAAPEPRARAERRKPERRQQWVESRRRKQQEELRAVEDSVREDTEAAPGREFRVERVRREFTAEPARIETPQIKLFGSE